MTFHILSKLFSFYTIKKLRDIVLPLSLSSEDLKRTLLCFEYLTFGVSDIRDVNAKCLLRLNQILLLICIEMIRRRRGNCKCKESLFGPQMDNSQTRDLTLRNDVKR